MQYKTITLALLQQRPQLHQQLREERKLLPTLEQYAQELKTSHETWTDYLWRTKPASPRQIASEALEMAVRELEDRLPSASRRDDHEALSLEEAVAFINNIHTSRG